MKSSKQKYLVSSFLIVLNQIVIFAKSIKITNQKISMKLNFRFLIQTKINWNHSSSYLPKVKRAELASNTCEITKR